MARYSLSVMKLLLNTNQPTKQIISSTVILTSHIHRDQDQDVENTVLRLSQDCLKMRQHLETPITVKTHLHILPTLTTY